MPVLIFLLFKCLNPIIRDTHSHTVVKTYASVLERNSKSGHTAHLFGYAYGMRIKHMNEFVGQSQIGYSIGVLITVVIIVITAECLTEAMIVVKHGGHAVKTETVKTELFHPIFAIGEQEVENLIFTVVKTERIPCRMFATTIAIKILVITAVKPAETLQFIFHSMRVNYIHNHGYSHGVRRVNKRFKFLRGAEST